MQPVPKVTALVTLVSAWATMTAGEDTAAERDWALATKGDITSAAAAKPETVQRKSLIIGWFPSCCLTGPPQMRWQSLVSKTITLSPRHQGPAVPAHPRVHGVGVKTHATKCNSLGRGPGHWPGVTRALAGR